MSTLVVTPTAESPSTGGGEGGATPLNDSPATRDGDTAPDATESLDGGEMNAPTEASLTPLPASEADAPAAGRKHHKRADRKGAGPVDPGDGDPRDPTGPSDAVAPTRGDQAVDDAGPEGAASLETSGPSGVPAARGHGTKHRKADRKAAAATGIATDPARATTVPAQDDETAMPAPADATTGRRRAGRHDHQNDHQTDSQSEPKADPTPETASPASPAEGPARDKPRDRDGRTTRPVDRGDSRQPADPNKAYRIVTTRQSPHTGDAAVVVDGDPATVWRTEPGATPAEASVVLDLGQPRTIGRVRWLEAADGLAGRMDVAVSTDGTRWTTAAGVEQEASGAWQELRLKHAVQARYVRVRFTHPSQERRLGGLAEVEVSPAALTEAKQEGSKHDRRRAATGASNATAGHERSGSGHHRGSPHRHGSQKDKHAPQDQDRNTQQASRKRAQRGRSA